MAILTRFVILAVGAVLMSGCVAYVNIPPQVGDLALHEPTHPHVIGAMAEALAAIVAKAPPTGRYAVQLPPGSDDATYDGVLARLGDQADPAQEGRRARAGVPVYEVTELRIRGRAAQVDAICPHPADRTGPSRQLTTAYLTWEPINGWLVDRVRVWRIAQDHAVHPHPDHDADTPLEPAPPTSTDTVGGEPSPEPATGGGDGSQGRAP